MKKYILSALFVPSLFFNVLKPKKYGVEVKNDEDGSVGKTCSPCPYSFNPVCGTDSKNN